MVAGAASPHDRPHLGLGQSSIVPAHGRFDDWERIARNIARIAEWYAARRMRWLEDDLVQEGWVGALKWWGMLRPEQRSESGIVRAYCTLAARQQMVSHIRTHLFRGKRTASKGFVFTDFVPTSLMDTERFGKHESFTDLVDAKCDAEILLSILPSRSRAVVEDRMDGLTLSEIGQKYAVTLQSVHKQYNRAMSKMKAYVS